MKLLDNIEKQENIRSIIHFKIGHDILSEFLLRVHWLKGYMTSGPTPRKKV